jgi:hypothetical protein
MSASSDIDRKSDAELAADLEDIGSEYKESDAVRWLAEMMAKRLRQRAQNDYDR